MLVVEQEKQIVGGDLLDSPDKLDVERTRDP